MKSVKAEHLRKNDVLADGRRLRADAVTWPGTSRWVVLPIAGSEHDYCGGENVSALASDVFEVERFGWEEGRAEAEV